jgi:hypothetical protein
MATPAGARLAAALARPVDAASLRVFRAAFGLLLAVAAVRFMAAGWIDRLYGEPSFFFRYWGFAWVPVASVPVLYAVWAVIAASGLAIAAGVLYRPALVTFLLAFGYVQLLDVTNYLNHHVLVWLLAGLLLVVPLGRGGPPQLPAWMLYLLRFQVAVVYVFAGLAKLNADWLLGAQPLHLWLTARTELTVVGPWLASPVVAHAMSWAGFLYDTTIVAWLSWRPTRAAAYVVVLAFHAGTHVLFNIGIFPFVMTLAATLFFAPDWPRRLWARMARRPATAPAPAPTRAPGRLGLALVAGYAAVQVLVPLRHHLYPGDVLWAEEGMRFAWKVMLREKHGSVTFHVRLADGREVQVSPRRYLSTRQEREMAAQPDLVLQLAHHIAADFRARGHGEVQVRAETLVSLNGRPARPMIDPARDLAREPDGLAPKDWILPGPAGPPKPAGVVAWK